MKIKARKEKKKVRAVVDRSWQLLNEGSYQEGLDFLKNAIDQFPDNAEIRMHYATVLLNFQPAEVRPQVVKAVELDPSDPTILVRAASIMVNRGDPDLARSYVARANALAQPDFSMLSPLSHVEGDLARLDGNYDLAEEKLRRAAEIDPTFFMPVSALAKLLSEQGKHTQALEAIDQALPIVKNKDELRRIRMELVQKAEGGERET
ncbi:MAG: tetratricopeptide repeat protein [Solirubrobacterales bacterium]